MKKNLISVLFFLSTIFLTSVIVPDSAISQCTNTSLYPPSDIEASHFNIPVTVATDSWPGQYFVVKNLSIGDTYSFTSSADTTDYITLRDEYGALLAHGNAPLSFTISGGDIIQVHINLISPPCGTDDVDRTTRVICTSCPPIPPGIGVGTSNPEAKLDIEGEIKVAMSVSPPKAGMIRWNDTSGDFEGYNGSKWVSFTKASALWGISNSNQGNENQKLTASDGAAYDDFGYSVSISGDYAIIGAPGDVIVEGGIGYAYVFQRSETSWTQQAKLTASDGVGGDIFGNSISIFGDYAIIGAYGDDVDGNANQGSAYVFQRSGTSWTQQAKLTAFDGVGGDIFGNSISISGDYAIIGANGDDVDGNTNQGSAYVFQQ